MQPQTEFMLSLKSLVFAFCNFLLLGLCISGLAMQKRDSQLMPHPRVQRDALLNGLQIVTLENTDARVQCELVVRSGAMFDLEGKTGLAALTQETLLAANARLEEEISSLQGEINWGLDWDITWFRIDIPAANFEVAIEILGRLLITETIRPDAFKQAQERQLARIKEQARSLTPDARADIAFRTAIYGQHPYGHSVKGDEQTIAAIKRGDVYDFYRRFYIANDSFALIVGPIGHERVLRAFKTLYGGWMKGSRVPETFRSPQQTTELRLVKIEVPDAPLVESRGGIIGLKVTDPDFILTEVIAHILEARLKRSAAAQPTDRVVVTAPACVLPGQIFFSASVTPDRANAFSRAATDNFAALMSAPVSTEELTAAKAELMSKREARKLTDDLRESEMYRDHSLAYVERLKAITAAEVQRVAKRLLGMNALTVVVLGPIGENFKSQK